MKDVTEDFINNEGIFKKSASSTVETGVRRPIKFKAKRMNGEWVYGYLSGRSSIKEVMPNKPTEYLVKGTTVCQYTGVDDTDGNPVYEHDILESEMYGIGVVMWDENKTEFHVYVNSNPEDDQYFFVKSFGKVIGNYFDKKDA